MNQTRKRKEQEKAPQFSRYKAFQFNPEILCSYAHFHLILGGSRESGVFAVETHPLFSGETVVFKSLMVDDNRNIFPEINSPKPMMNYIYFDK